MKLSNCMLVRCKYPLAYERVKEIKRSSIKLFAI
jgi:hypothetical protein